MKSIYKLPVSFYPGPSKVYPAVEQYLQEAYQSGILSANHRSQPFMDLMRNCVATVKQKLGIPPQYHVYFCSAATECWEIISQAYPNLPSYHVYNGAFGEKWWKYRAKIHPQASGFEWPAHRLMPHQRLKPPDEKGLICLTQNETSNGTQLSNRLLSKVKKRFPKALVCIDATSSMAGVELDWLSGDIWYASVQKCFGLPAGLAVMVCSPKALAWAGEEGRFEHYNSLLNIDANAQKHQTTHTPNVLNIFLLNKIMGEVAPIRQTSRHIKKRARYIRQELQKRGYQLLSSHERIQSPTVIAVKGSPSGIQLAKEKALANGFLLGNGYGRWKETSFRIANFPAITDEEVEGLLSII